MKAKDVIDRSVLLLGIEGNALQREALLNCFNDLYEEITVLLPNLLKLRERVKTEDGGRIFYSQFSRKVRKILTVRDLNGVRLAFTPYAAYFETSLPENEELDVVYQYRADPLDEEGEPELSPRFTVYPLAVGTAGEYCYRMGLVEEGQFYQARYRALMSALSDEAQILRLPLRRWL